MQGYGADAFDSAVDLYKIKLTVSEHLFDGVRTQSQMIGSIFNGQKFILIHPYVVLLRPRQKKHGA